MRVQRQLIKVQSLPTSKSSNPSNHSHRQSMENHVERTDRRKNNASTMLIVHTRIRSLEGDGNSRAKELVDSQRRQLKTTKKKQAKVVLCHVRFVHFLSFSDITCFQENVYPTASSLSNSHKTKVDSSHFSTHSVPLFCVCIFRWQWRGRQAENSTIIAIQ